MFRAQPKKRSQEEVGNEKIVGEKTNFFLDFVAVVFLRHASHYYVTSRHVLLIKK